MWSATWRGRYKSYFQSSLLSLDVIEEGLMFNTSTIDNTGLCVLVVGKFGSC